jgi:N-glycosylase/DNA lyase
MPKLTVNNFNLVHTLECGQIFRVKKIDDWYYINARDKFFKVRQQGNESVIARGEAPKQSCLEFHGVKEGFLNRFFSLDEPLEQILAEINKDKHINAAITQYHGLRLIRQDPWECFISFICSPASNIGKITSTLDKLSEYFGRRHTLDGVQSYAFPEPGRINNTAKVKKSGAGFRTRYIIEANKDGVAWTNSFVRVLKTLPYEQAKKELKKILGIGDKVADCILLFSLGFTEAFPVDVWIKKVIQELYFNNQPVPNREIGDFARSYFGKYAGYAQEYLYYYRRTLS